MLPNRLSTNIKLFYTLTGLPGKWALRSNSSATGSREMEQLKKLWSLVPPSACIDYPASERSFSISTHADPFRYKQRMCIQPSEPNPVLAKYPGQNPISRATSMAMWMMNPCLHLHIAGPLLPSTDDVIVGGRQVFRRILQAVIENRVRSLDPATLGLSTLDFHHKRAASLTDNQRIALQVSNDDFLGTDGFLCNWNGHGQQAGSLSRYIHRASVLPHDVTGHPSAPQFIYSVVLAALVDKNKVYRSCEDSPSNHLLLPADYRFVSPRYVVMRIDLCHQITNHDPLTLGEDALIYDYHIMSF